MPRYLLHLAYDGTCYCGWQKQPDKVTIQGVIEKALETVTQEYISLYASGRTDSGVHASEQFAHFDTHIPVEEIRLAARLQKILPDDIKINGIRAVPDLFHARFDAQWRQYRYQVLLSPDPFLRLFAWYPGDGMDFEVLNQGINVLEGEHDFSGFTRKASDMPHCRCTIHKAIMEHSSPNMMVIRIRANRFMRSMMRALVGGLISIASGKKNLAWFKNHLENGRDLNNIPLAPGSGLFLEKVFYPGSILDLTS